MSRIALLIAAALVTLAGCSAASGAEGPAAGSVTAENASAPARTTIRFALDWTPNTNHTGLYVAAQQGWFDDAGLDIEILPYNDAQPDTLVDAGAAEFGVSFQDTSTLAQAAGADVVSVFAVLQHWATAIGVRADRADIGSPKDLDGKTYGGFGGPVEEPLLSTVIARDGGTGNFTSVMLGTSAYQAVYSGDVDFTIPFIAWEGIEAERNGTPMKYFPYTDHGFPDAYSVVIDGNRSWLAGHPAAAAGFIAALERGYAFAAADPAAAATMLIEANPAAFPDEDLVRESQQLLAKSYLLDADGKVGTQTVGQWAAYGTFLFDNGLLTGPDGSPLAQRPDFAGYFTDQYLTGS